MGEAPVRRERERAHKNEDGLLAAPPRDIKMSTVVVIVVVDEAHPDIRSCEGKRTGLDRSSEKDANKANAERGGGIVQMKERLQLATVKV
jgi:hypothetical protein